MIHDVRGRRGKANARSSSVSSILVGASRGQARKCLGPPTLALVAARGEDESFASRCREDALDQFGGEGIEPLFVSLSVCLARDDSSC